jgi:hypothetical protein
MSHVPCPLDPRQSALFNGVHCFCCYAYRGGFISSNIRAAQLEAVKAAQQKALAMLREMNTALGTCTTPCHGHIMHQTDMIRGIRGCMHTAAFQC